MQSFNMRQTILYYSFGTMGLCLILQKSAAYPSTFAVSRQIISFCFNYILLIVIHFLSFKILSFKFFMLSICHITAETIFYTSIKLCVRKWSCTLLFWNIIDWKYLNDILWNMVCFSNIQFLCVICNKLTWLSTWKIPTENY